MNKNLQPSPVVLLGSVVALFLSMVAYRFTGGVGLMGAAFVLNVALGMAVSLRWPLNPWRIGVVAVIPSIAFLIWRWMTLSSAEDVALNNSLFVFLPIISLASSYFGGFIGRSIVIRRMKLAHLKETK